MSTANLTISRAGQFRDEYKLTRSDGVAYTVRGLAALGRAMLAEVCAAAQANAAGAFIVQDAAGKSLKFNLSRGTFSYS